MLPSVSKNSIPSCFIVFAASLETGFRRCKKVLKDVPASEPRTPASANAASAAVVSCIVKPDATACCPVCCSAIAMSATSAAEALAAPARASTIDVESFALRLNVFMPADMMTADSASPMPEAAARFSVLESAPASI